MSSQIDTALVQQYQNNIEVGFQQRESRLRPAVTIDNVSAEYSYYDRVTQTAAQELFARHQDTPLIETPHDRRRVAMRDFVWADLIDDQDKVRMLADPTAAYTQNALHAMSRAQDQIIIDAADATAQTGKTGTGSATLPATQILQVSATDTANSGGATTNLTIAKLRRAKYLIDSNEAHDPGEGMFFICSASQIQSLLRTTEVTSADYNSVKALVNGEVNSFMGFNFIRTELLDVASNVRDCYAWTSGGMLMALGMDITVRVSERNDKNHAVQVFTRFTAGAVRTWEEKVVKVQCNETA